MKVLLILKIGRGKVTNFSEVTKFFPDENFPRLFLPDKVFWIVTWNLVPANIRNKWDVRGFGNGNNKMETNKLPMSTM